MKKLLIGILLFSIAFCGPTSFGGIAIKDVLLIDSVSKLYTTPLATSINAAGQITANVTMNQLPTMYSTYVFDSTTATLNAQFVTDSRRTDGQLIYWFCKGFVNPISLTTNVYIPVKTFGGSSANVDVLYGDVTSNMALAATGDMRSFMYYKGKYFYLGGTPATINRTY